MQFLFILGRKVDLCFAEVTRVVEALYPEAKVTRVLDNVALVDGITVADAVILQKRLGGTTKICQVESSAAPVGTETLETLAATLLQSLMPEGSHSITFGVAEYGRESLDALNLTHVKKLLKEQHVSARFIDSPRFGLSASVLLHQDVEEVVIVKSRETLWLGYTVTIQNIDDWTIRDREKPRSDRKRGMLPPKLARIMVNLAAPGSRKVRLLDPFCGTGTVLLEGLILGYDVIGSDIRQEAVQQTSDNVTWVKTRYPEITGQAQVLLADATHLTAKELGGKVDTLVAEGLLGPLTPNPKSLPDIFRGLTKLYRGTLKQWANILEPGATLCLALPRVDIGKQSYSLASLIDTTPEIGYNIVCSPLIYDRPEAVVKREIFLLTYQGK